MIPILLLVTATFRPAAPTVGDPITIQFPAAVTLDRSADYELLAQRGNTVVIRTFQPHPFAISGRTAGVAFRNMTVPVRSVLKPNDNMKPAPLDPPIREPYPRLPFIAIAIAALAAIAAWTAAALRREKAAQPAVPALPPAQQFRATVIALRDHSRMPMRWARLADAMREYLAATSDLSRDLTTSEVLSRAGQPFSPVVAQILRQGDLEKFSPWGPQPADFTAIANQALELVPEERAEEQAA
jgi:hypothetical protein